MLQEAFRAHLSSDNGALQWELPRPAFEGQNTRRGPTRPVRSTRSHGGDLEVLLDLPAVREAVVGTGRMAFTRCHQAINVKDHEGFMGVSSPVFAVPPPFT